MDPLDRVDHLAPRAGRASELLLPALRQPDGRRRRGRAGGAGRRHRAPLSIRGRRDDGARPVAARAGQHDRARPRRVLRHRHGVRRARVVGSPRRRVRPDGAAARRRPARLARGAHQPVPHDAGSRGGCRPPGPGRRRCDRGHAGSPAATGARRRLRLAQRDEVPRGPRRRAARRGGLPRRHRCRGAADVPQQHRHRRRAGSCLAHAPRPEDARAARTAADRDRRLPRRAAARRIRLSRPSAIPASAGSSPSTWPMPRRRGRSRRRHA